MGLFAFLRRGKEIKELRRRIEDLERKPKNRFYTKEETRRHLTWLIEKSGDVQNVISKGGNQMEVGAAAGVLHQEMLNILVPLIHKDSLEK